MSNLPKIPITQDDINRIKIKRIYKSDELDNYKVKALDSTLVDEFYGELKFKELYDDRPYLYTSLVTSIDGRIAYSDDPEGPNIARLNKYDTDGADSDWLILNALRTAADGVIVGANTMTAEVDYTVHVFYEEMEGSRVRTGKPDVPWNIITSLNGSDIPYNHKMFEEAEVPVMISTSVDGLDNVKKNLNSEYIVIGPFKSKEDVDKVDLNNYLSERDKVLVLATGSATPDAKVTMYALKKLGFDQVLVETPAFAHYLVAQELMDEFFFNYSCVYIGGEALTIGESGKEFTSTDHPHTRMLSIHSHSDHFFYFRHKLLYN